VIEVADADQALTLEARLGRRLDLLITDVVLPRRSGLELATALRLRRPGLRVLFMSGYTDDRTRLVREAAGNFLQKPFGPEALARKARETLDRQPSLPSSA
jgi:two-component system, cell cycle sensor histidine kinase and response regulator CckA